MEEKKTENKYPGITIDNSLDAYDGAVIFSEKLKKANEDLKKSGLPKEITETKRKQLDTIKD